MSFKVAIPQTITDAGKDYLREKGYELLIGSGATDVGSMKKAVTPADAILARTAPFTAEILAAAKCMVNAKLLSTMKKTAFLVNCSRGEVSVI